MGRSAVIHILLVSIITSFSRAEPNTETPHVSDQTNTEEVTTTLQPLPRDCDNFRDIILGKKVFADKTFMIAQLLDAHTRLVLFTRPRRFGKTLFIGMLEEFFKGNSELFKSTNIFSRGNTEANNGTWKEYPVIYLDFWNINLSDSEPTIEEFRKELYDLVQEVADSYGVGDCEGTGQCRNLRKLIVTLRSQFKMLVVILVDEYDHVFAHPSLSAGTKTVITPLLESVTQELQKFFGIIKANSRHIKLAYVTGVSKLAFASLSGSGGNNFVDISLDYPTMAGFSMDELKRNFWPHIENVATTGNITAEDVMRQLREKYDGYRFSLTDETRVFNPISTINCLRTCVFGNFWLYTASLQLIVDKIIESNVTLDAFRGVMINAEDILRRYSALDVPMPLTVTLLFYGYLTIKEFDARSKMLTVDFPNREIEEALNNAVLIARHVKHPGEVVSKYGEKLRLSLMNQDVKEFMTCMNNIGFKSYGGEYDSSGIEDEFYPTRVVDAILRTSGILTEVGKVFYDEKGTRRGDLDLQIVCGKNHYVFEMKYKTLNTVEGMVQLVEYIVNDECLFRENLLKFRSSVLPVRDINNDYDVILVSAKMKENVFREFISLPYRINSDGTGELVLEEVNTVSETSQMKKLKGELSALGRRYPDSKLLKNVHNISCKLL